MMFTPSKLFKSVASKVTRRSVQSTSPNGAQSNASPKSPIAIAAARDAEQESPFEEVFASPTQEIATSQQGTPDDAVNHGRRTSAVGLLQLGSVLAGATPLQQEQSVTTPRQRDAAQELAVDMPASFEQALVPASDESSWPYHSASLARQYPLPSKRSAIDDDVDAFLESRQAKRQCSSHASDRQLATYNTVRSSPTSYPQLPAPVSAAGPPFHAVHALPLPSPKPAAAAALPPRGQLLPGPSRFSQQAGSSVAFARPAQGQSAFAGRLPPSANPFSIGANGKRKQDTPRFQQHKSARSRLDAGRSPLTATSAKTLDVPKYPRFSFGTAQQAPMLQGGQSPIPRSIFPSQKAAFGSPFPALPPATQLASSSHAQQALWPRPASPQGHAGQQTASPQQASGLAARHSPAGTSSTPTAASMEASGSASGQSARQDGTATHWTPMKASADLPHQALVDKVTKGKQLLPNSLIGAGLDPARLASTPRPQGLRRFQGVTPKRKVDELEGSHEQDAATEEQGRQKQARTAAPVASQQPRTLAFAPPPTTLLGFAPPLPAISSLPIGLVTSNAQTVADITTAGQIANAVPMPAATENQTEKDYGAAWMAAAAQNDKATSSPAATADMPSDVASPPFTDAAPKGTGQTAHNSPVATLPNHTPLRSSLTDSLNRQTPAFPSFTPLPSTAAGSSTPQATPHLSPFRSIIPSSPATQSVTPTALPLDGSGSIPAASASAPWAISTAHASPLQWGASQQQPQPQQQVSTTPIAVLNAAAMTNGPSKQAEGQDDGKGEGQAEQTAASTSSEGSRDTREEIYPFPTHRSAQDRLAGIVSSLPYAEENSRHQYVFGRRQRTLADQNMFGQTTQAVPVPDLSKPAVGMSGAAQQDGYLSPEEAKRLHTMSTIVPLPSPGLESDSEPEAHEAAHDDIQANGKRVTPDTDGAASDGDWIQTSSIMTVISSSSSSSGDSYIDDGSDVSVISGMSNSDDDSMAPTEVVEDEEQDATVVLGAQASAVSGWDPSFLQKHSAAAQEAAAAEAVQKASTAQQEHVADVAQRAEPAQQAEAAELAVTHRNMSEEVAVQPAEPLQASSKASAAAPEEPEASKPAGNAPAPLWQNAQPTFPASKPLSRVFMQAIDAPLPDDVREAAAVPATDPPAPAVQPTEEGVQDAGPQPRRRLKVRRNR